MEVIFSDFAANAPKDTSIVIKNHPLDNGMSNVAKACYKLADRYGITDRVIFIDGGRLRGLLRACIGAITVNSTAGLNALDIGKPVKVMGDALYDIKGICDQAELKTFWQNPTQPNMKLYNSFKKCLTLYCLINGSFFSSVGRQLVLDHIERFEQYGIIRNDGQTKLSEQGQKQDIIDVSSNSDKNTFPSDPALRQVS